MSLELHEWDIHIVCHGAGDADGAGGAAAQVTGVEAGTETRSAQKLFLIIRTNPGVTLP
jgi:hypothetical protein